MTCDRARITTMGLRPLAYMTLATLLASSPAVAQTTPTAPAPAATPAPQAAAAQPAAQHDAEALAKQTQNPISTLITFPMQANFDFGLGERGATGTTLNIQPVMPFSISSSTNVVLRVIMPLMSRPGPDETIRFNGVGDLTMTAFFVPKKARTITWGVGPAFNIPSATNNRLGTEKFGIGPSAVALVQPGHWTAGVLFNQIWSTSGATNRDDLNITFTQVFVSYNLGQGLSVGADFQATANWEADEHWNSPLIFKVSKVTSLGSQHVNLEAGAGPVFASADAAASWRFRFLMVFLFPK